MEKQFNNALKNPNSIILEKRYRALYDLLENKHLKRYPHQYKCGILGMTYEQLQIVNSEAFRNKAGLTKQTFSQRISRILRNVLSRPK
uniref:Uncharacterized protein n=1 Tax=Acrobeloides nanus TaxID=290746 RepID=A0A914DEH1_9BILA